MQNQEHPATKASTFANVFLDIAAILAPVLLTVLFCRYLFFKFSTHIWATNSHLNPEGFTPWIQPWIAAPKDGLECVVLYFIVFLSLIFLYLFFACIKQLSKFKLYRPCIFALTFISCAMFWFGPSVIPPYVRIANRNVVLAITLILMLPFFYLENLSAKIWIYTFTGIFLIPFCFIPSSEISLFDSMYIFIPSWRWLQGIPISDIYFQYDLLPSIICLPILMNHAPIENLQFFCQISLWGLFFVVFYISSKYFLNSYLSIPLLFGMLIFKIYVNLADASAIPQVTPIRLDLWAIPIFLSFRFGFFHWSTGLCLGGLCIVHQNFGNLYALAYFQTIFTIMISSCTKLNLGYSKAFIELRKIFILYFRKSSLNISIIIAGMLIISMTMGSFGPSPAAQMFRSLGIGFSRINDQSFYWFIFALKGILLLLLLNYKPILCEKYFHAGIFLVMLTLAQSMYFFGRSHENNLVNISAIVLFVLFLIFDIIIYALPVFSKISKLALSLQMIFSFLVVGLMACIYSDKISIRVRQQLKYLDHPNMENKKTLTIDIEILKKIIAKYNNKIFVLAENDAYYYYECNLTPPLYFSPLSSYIYNSSLIDEMKRLMNQGYYVAIPDLRFFESIARNQTVFSDYHLYSVHPYWLLQAKNSPILKINEQ